MTTVPSTTKQQARARILVVDDESGARSALAELLREEGFEVQSAADGFKALGKVDGWTPDLVITDLKMPGMDGIALMEKLRERMLAIPVVVMTAFGTVESAVEAIQHGADDYLTKPLQLGALLVVVERVLETQKLRREAERLRHELQDRERPPGSLIGQSRPFRDMLALIEQVAGSDAAVLVQGESGTGKESVAKILHQRSGRAEGPWVTLHCASLSEEAVERELFGYAAGAFAGATTAYEGKLVQASGGTLFLDEVADLPMATQGKLLATLRDREVEPVGGSNKREIDLRVVTATDGDLRNAVQRGAFREDLFYRLNVITIRVPTLRERQDDIPLLATHFMQQHARKNGKSLYGFTERTLGVMLHFDWPGNIRQLQNCVERAVVMARSDEIEPRDLPRELMSNARGSEEMPTIPGASLREIERYAILRSLEHVGGSTSKAAKILGISPRKIQYRLNEYREEDEGS